MGGQGSDRIDGDADDDVLIGPDDDCAAMGGLNEGTTVLAENRWGEPYCGSERAIAYRTIQNERKGFNAYGSFEYRFSDNLSWFADVQLGRQDVRLLTGTNGNDVVSDIMGWEFHDPTSTDNNDKIFYNAVTGRLPPIVCTPHVPWCTILPSFTTA